MHTTNSAPLLREYYPAILAAFADKRDGLLRPEARAVLGAAPTPAAGAALTKTQLRALLKRAGRRRGVDVETDRIQAALRSPQLRHPPMVETAFGRQALALLRLLNAACTNAEELATEATNHFDQHPDAEIITSLPGLGSLTGARVLAEIGDDRSRFANARALKAYAGAAPVTRASGKSLTVMHRRVKNQRLASVGYLLGLRRAHRLTRRPRPLRPTQSRRRPAHRRPTQPVQPHDRHPAPLPRRRHQIRRAHRLSNRRIKPVNRRGLTN